MRVLFALAVSIALTATASAADWRYCLAPSHAQHKIYISAAFPATLSMEEIEAQFGSILTRSGLRYDDVQCPRSDDRSSMLVMQRHAIEFNHELGNQIITIRWKPAG